MTPIAVIRSAIRAAEHQVRLGKPHNLKAALKLLRPAVADLEKATATPATAPSHAKA